MKRWTIPLLAVCLACNPEPPPGADAGPSDSGLPACPTEPDLFGMSESGEKWLLQTRAELPVILGFQGFLFTQVSLRGASLEGHVIHTHVLAEGVADIWGEERAPSVLVAGDVYETEPVLFFFNDVSRSDLIGKSAQIRLITSTATCAIDMSASATLTSDP